MKRLITISLVVLLVPALAQASWFTMSDYQLQNLYEVYENPSHAGTYLNPVQAITNGAKYTGNIRTTDPGWGQIQIGAEFWGTPWGGSPGDEATLAALGLGSLSGYNYYSLGIENANEHDWMFNLYFNVGYTDWGETDYYIQNSWTTIGAGSKQGMKIDFSNAQVWGGGYTGQFADISTIGGLDLSHISNIGINIGGDVPVGPDDYTFEAKVTSGVPEPTTLILFGLGMLGLGVRRKFRK